MALEEKVMARRPYKYGGIGQLPSSEAFKGQSGKPGVLYRMSYTDREIGRGKKGSFKPFIFIPFSKFRRVK